MSTPLGMIRAGVGRSHDRAVMSETAVYGPASSADCTSTKPGQWKVVSIGKRRGSAAVGNRPGCRLLLCTTS